MNKRIWVISELFWPEDTSTGHFITRIARRLADSGYLVTVLCGQPKYDRAGQQRPARETWERIEVRRAPGTTLNRHVVPFRVINILTISFSLFLAALRDLRRGDLVLVATNPPLAPFAIVPAAWLRRAITVLMLQDVYPDTLVAAGLVGPRHPVTRVLEWMTACLYRAVDRITVVGRDMSTLVHRKLRRANDPRVSVITNWADVTEVTPADKRGNALLDRLGLADKFVVQYAGNMGPVQDVESILEVARRLRGIDPQVHFLFIGGGAKWSSLAETVEREQLTNVSVHGSLPRDQQQVFLNACDVAISALVPGMTGVGVPSRMYNIMASGKPMIAATDADSEQALVIGEEQIGWVTPPHDVVAMVQAILEAKSNQDRLRRMGQAARNAALTRYSDTVITDKYLALVRSLVTPENESASPIEPRVGAGAEK